MGECVVSQTVQRPTRALTSKISGLPCIPIVKGTKNFSYLEKHQGVALQSLLLYWPGDDRDGRLG